MKFNYGDSDSAIQEDAIAKRNEQPNDALEALRLGWCGLKIGGMMRRSWLVCGLACGFVWTATGPVQAQVAPATSPVSGPPGGRPSPRIVWPSNLPTPMPLWPTGAPGSQGSGEEDTPTIAAFIPASNPTKTAVVIAPGGGYVNLAIAKEGSDVAAWLNARGVAAFVLRYRLGPKYHHPIELGDAQRAIRTVRANADQYGIAPDHIGMWGFSAGGHLTASAGTMFDAGNAASADSIEQQSSRPDFLILAYPVITMQDPYVHKGSRTYLLGNAPPQELMEALSPEMHVTAQTPPTFLFSTTDDKTVPVLNSVMFYTALVKAGVPAEMHIFQHGGHGAGLAQANPQLSPWTEMLIKWMRERGYAADVTP